MNLENPPSQLEGFVAEGEGENEEEIIERPEDCIPDLPENQAVREFLRKAPTKGLHMPLGKEVKVMQCWRCKAYGHRTGDRECPMRDCGNLAIESQRRTREDPMSEYMSQTDRDRMAKYERVEQLRLLVEEIRAEERERKRRKEERKAVKRKRSSSEEKSKRYFKDKDKKKRKHSSREREDNDDKKHRYEGKHHDRR